MRAHFGPVVKSADLTEISIDRDRWPHADRVKSAERRGRLPPSRAGLRATSPAPVADPLTECVRSATVVRSRFIHAGGWTIVASQHCAKKQSGAAPDADRPIISGLASAHG